jgi:hypothetical protein
MASAEKYISKELLRDLTTIKPRINRYNKRYEYEAYEYDRGIYIVDVGGVKPKSNGEKDLLLSNFWALLIGTLRDANVGDTVDIGGGSYTIRSAGDVNSGMAYLVYGTGVDPSYFTQYSLQSRKGFLASSVDIAYLSDRTRISISGILPEDVYEIGVEQLLYDTGGYVRTILLARTTGSFSRGKAVVYNIDFLYPWVRQIGDLLFGTMIDKHVIMVDVNGVVFLSRTGADPNAGSVYLVLSSSPVTWSPSLYNIPSPLTPSSFYYDNFGSRSLRMTYVHGMMSPSTDIAVNTIALYQPIFRSDGTSMTVCHLVIPLSSPATFYGNKNNLIVLRIIAM